MPDSLFGSTYLIGVSMALIAAWPGSELNGTHHQQIQLSHLYLNSCRMCMLIFCVERENTAW